MNNKTVVIIVIVIGALIVVGGLILLLSSGSGQQPTAPAVPESLKIPEIPAPIEPVVEEVSPDDSTTSIQQELDAFDLGDLEAEFEEIDSDLQSL